MTTETLSAVIFVTFVFLLVVGAVSTVVRTIRYHRQRLSRPVLLGRDRDLLLGLAIPFVILAAVRAFPELREFVHDNDERPHFWYVFITGLPPIYALLRYDYFELWVIEKHHRDRRR